MVSKLKKARVPLKVFVDEGSQSTPKLAPRSTPDSRKQLRKPMVSPEVMAAKNPEKKRTKGARSDAFIIKPQDLNLKSCVSPEELGFKIGRIQETRTKELLGEVECETENRGIRDTVFRDVVCESGLICHLVPTVEAVILEINPTAENEEITEAVRSCLQEETPGEIIVCMRKKPFRGTRKAYVMLEEVSALIVLKAVPIKFGWVSCRVRSKTKFTDATVALVSAT